MIRGLLFGLLIAVLFHSCERKSRKMVIGVSQCSDDAWRDKMNMEMLHETALHSNIELIVLSANDNNEQQIQHIQQLIDQKVDLLIISPNEAAPLTPVVEKAYDLGFPVLLVDRKILSDRYTAFIGADNYAIGQEVGTYVSTVLGRAGTVLEIKGLEGSTPAIDRNQGFYSTTSRFPDLKVVESFDAEWSEDIAYEKTLAFLNSQKRVDLIFAHNDRMASGAFKAAKELGIQDSIAFVGIDALPGEDGGIEKVLEKELTATFIYPTGGDRIIQLALKILNDETYEKNNPLVTAVVDFTNARVLKLQSDEILDQRDKIDYFNTRIDVFTSQYAMQQYLLYSAIAIVLLLVVLSLVQYRAYRSKTLMTIKLEQKNDAISKQKQIVEEQRDQLVELSRKLEEATFAKLMFFTNISHEFRTPLTLIAGPLGTLLESEDLKSNQKRLLTLAQRNVEILLKLVDQIIDFRKFETGQLHLDLQWGDIKQVIESWNESVQELAIKKRVRLSFSSMSDVSYTMPFDLLKFESIYLNLLSNALKFTPSDGFIKVNLAQIEKDGQPFLSIEVSNSGKGIPKENRDRLFDRYYQIESGAGGSGIGLAIVKAFAELHRGSVEVVGDTSSTTFKVLLPYHQPVAEIGKHSPEAIADRPMIPVVPQPTKDPFVNEQDIDDRQKVLVIDDNPEICSYVRLILESKFLVLEAEDGLSGYKIAMKHVPDLIISDVMMPGMDGVDLSRKLKTEISTSHIPIILLTACSLDEQRITGLESGADDYISKPFNVKILEARIQNLLENRKRLKEVFSAGFFSKSDSPELDKDADQSFINKFRHLLEDNYTESELNVEDLGRNMGLSRSQLYRKTKALTNYSPNELLRIMRLQKAQELINTSELSVSEIAYRVGFTSPSYFAKCFKDYYDKSPTDYQK
ncbi:DNA-binding response regulator, AraC family [Geofilum rubicundum JCM 15548]|uniref:histidine kinase n=2 Tax=Geofilum TaxID=1236988 RepID=A0A0E9LT66_9BACT|nr:DNA-binding response regulator, AraC family [Geofilum rubicundum JCM 15548]